MGARLRAQSGKDPGSMPGAQLFRGTAGVAEKAPGGGKALGGLSSTAVAVLAGEKPRDLVTGQEAESHWG